MLYFRPGGGSPRPRIKHVPCIVSNEFPVYHVHLLFLSSRVSGGVLCVGVVG